MERDKYVVFKREDSITVTDGYVTFRTDSELPDSVVIRRQDLFAGPALHTYAAMIALAAKLMHPSMPQQPQLQVIADYFHEQAVLADDEGRKIPD